MFVSDRPRRSRSFAVGLSRRHDPEHQLGVFDAFKFKRLFLGDRRAIAAIEIFSLPDLPPKALSSELDAAPILISRGRAVTVFVLEHLLGLPTKPGRRHALVVEGPDGRIGFSVGALGGIDVIQEEHNLPASGFQDPGVREACNGNCVIVREDKKQALLPHFDLRELAKLHSQVKPQSNAA